MRPRLPPVLFLPMPISKTTPHPFISTREQGSGIRTEMTRSETSPIICRARHFSLNDYFDFIAPSDFTNSGVVTIGEHFAELQPHFVLPKDHRYVQTEGATHLWGGAVIGDMEINGGSFDTFGGGWPDIHPAVLNGNLAIGDALFAPRGFVVHGAVQLSAGSTFSTSGEFG